MINSKADNENLSREEILELIRKSQEGDLAAQEEIVTRNIGLVNSVVKKYSMKGVDYEDLFQIGCIGLVKAVKNFNPEYNVMFSTYAVPMILGEIRRYFRDDGLIKVSRSIKENSRKIKAVRESYFKEYGKDATIEEISKELGMDSEDVIMCLESSYNTEYLYDVISNDDNTPILLIDKLSEDKDYGSEVVDRVALSDIIHSLEPRARQVMILRYFKDKTQAQIAQMLGISQVQVSRIEKKVIKYLREHII